MSVAALFCRYLRDSWYRTAYVPDNEINIKGKIVVITGSNSGIGEVAAFEMAKRGAVVVMACRDMGKAKKVVEAIKEKFPGSQIVLVELDLGSLESVQKCAGIIKSRFDHIDILINNAGVVFDDGVLRTTKDEFEMHMGVNHLGHFLFTGLLLDHIKKGNNSRIVTTSSSACELSDLDVEDLMLKNRGSFGTNNAGPYANSKLANVYFSRALAKKLKGTGVTTYSVCPGMVNTDIGRSSNNKIRRYFQSWIALTPEQGVETILYCALSNACAEESGQMYRFCKPYTTTLDLHDDVESKLWEKSEALVGLKY